VPTEIVIASPQKLQRPEICPVTFVLMLTIFHCPKAKTFWLASFLAKKKNLLGLQASFSLARKLAIQKVFVSG
jgi:hypothetical protein